MERNGKGLFGPGRFYRSALAIAVPIMLQQLIQSLVSLVDNFMVSGLGDVCMSGVNVAGQVLFIFMVFLNAICMSGGIFMTQFFGAKDRGGMGQAFRFKLVAGMAAFVPYCLVCLVFPRQVLSLMLIGNTQAEAILDEAVQYIRIMFFIGIPMTASVCIASSLRDLGRVRTPLVVTVIATLTNTLFNWLLIYGNLGFPALGVRGAAWATVISQFISAFLIFYVLWRSRDIYSVSFKEMHLDFPVLRKIIGIGMPAGLQMAVTSFSNVFVQAYINYFGAASTTGWGVYFRVDAFILMPMMTIALAVTTFAGQNAGARNAARIREGLHVAMRMAEIGTLMLAIPALIFAPRIIRWFVVAYGTLFIRTNCWFAVFACLNQVYAGTLRGIGDARAPMYIMLFSFVVFRQIYLFILSHVYNVVQLVSFGYPLGWMMCSLLEYLYFRMSHWEARL